MLKRFWTSALGVCVRACTHTLPASRLGLPLGDDEGC